MATGTPLHLVHVLSTGGRQTANVLRLLGIARDRGVDVTSEMYRHVLVNGVPVVRDGRVQNAAARRQPIRAQR